MPSQGLVACATMTEDHSGADWLEWDWAFGSPCTFSWGKLGRLRKEKKKHTCSEGGNWKGQTLNFSKWKCYFKCAFQLFPFPHLHSTEGPLTVLETETIEMPCDSVYFLPSLSCLWWDASKHGYRMALGPRSWAWPFLTSLCPFPRTSRSLSEVWQVQGLQNFLTLESLSQSNFCGWADDA